MARVYSINTGARLDQQDYTENDALANKGEYLGQLPKLEAEAMRQFQNKLICEKAKIDELIQEFDLHYQDYLENVLNVLIYLDTDYQKFDDVGSRIRISSDGNVWIANK